MTIVELLADLEAKAKNVTPRLGTSESIARELAFRDACSPDRILALVAWAKEVQELLKRAKVLMPWNTGEEEEWHADLGRSSRRCCKE